MKVIGAMPEGFSVRSDQREHSARLRISGELDIATAPILERWLGVAESNGNTTIVLDLEEVTFMDASGLHSFLQAAERADRSGRSFAIVNAPAVVRRVLALTGSTHLIGSELPMEGWTIGVSSAS